MSDKILAEIIEQELGKKTLDAIEIPKYISDNIRFDLWDWQKHAIQYFLAYSDPKNQLKPSSKPLHLLFNMATGTGKTLIMAGLILHYYKQGYRSFIFFVNQNNIVEKTESNLLDKQHSKYLFKESIVIDGRRVEIKKVESFSKDSDNIQIKFTTIHKLHNDIYTVRENAVYLDDLQRRDVVMLADEGHHLNADTKKGKQNDFVPGEELTERASDAEVERSWENTVIEKILSKGDSKSTKENKNVLLEFTATVPEDIAVQDKYLNKIVYKYDLKDFVAAGYTKEINLIYSSFNKKQRILQALVLNWYRHEIAMKNSIHNFKPVILFRSKLIDESRNDFQFFKKMIKDLKVTDFDFLKKSNVEVAEIKEVYEKGISRIRKVHKYIETNKISYSNIIKFLQDEFNDHKCIITNSIDNTAKTKEKTSEDVDRLLNSLENKNNHIRAIFTVKRLTEGWDVLNLFDIVRLYEGRDEYHDDVGTRKAGETTIQEVQLIGRGVRYFPFKYKDKQLNKRKFDEDLDNELRCLEEFYYHSDDDMKYIDELKRELKHRGLIQEKRIIKKYEIKSEFKNGKFYKNVKVFKNDQEDNPNKRKNTLEDLREILKEHSYTLDVFHIKEEKVNLQDKTTDVVKKEVTKDLQTITKKIHDFEKHIFFKALNRLAANYDSIYRFNNLQEELNIDSIDDLFTDRLLGKFNINIVTEKGVNFDNIENIRKVEIIEDFLYVFGQKLSEYSNPHRGTNFYQMSFDDLFAEPKEKGIVVEEGADAWEKEVVSKPWYVLNAFTGNEEEYNLVKFIEKFIGNLEEEYDNVHLLRNEEMYKIYDFKQGRGFQPDYLLFLKKNKKDYYMQIFIEVKGGHLVEHDEWKEDFLKEISKKHGMKNILKSESDEYILYGLPFYTEKEKQNFEKEFKSVLLKNQIKLPKEKK